MARAERIMVTRVGLQMPFGLTLDNWEKAGRRLARVIDSSAWCLGDWIVYGQEHYVDRYRAAIERVGLDYQTLRNYAWVSRRFHVSRRRSALSFQHHAEVAGLSDEQQDHWLAKAEEARWSRNQLRQQIRLERDKGRGTEELAALPKIHTDAPRVQRWRDAAELSEERFEDWVLSCLDARANAILDACHVKAGNRPAAEAPK